VDEILELVPGSHIKALKHIAPDEDYFQDHFPGFPVVPGVLLTEMLGQAAGKCLAAEDKGRGKPMLAQIKSASFREWVGPGQNVTLIADIRASRPQFANAVCHAEVGSRTVCSAELFFTFVPADRFAANDRDEVLEAFLARQIDGITTPTTFSHPDK
jgi:3-hydroxyacyl-[acyl-carrier-protein] dehydratase